MVRSQPVLRPLSRAAKFLVLTVDDDGEDAVRDLLAEANDLRKSVGFRDPDGNLDLILGIGSDLWDRLFDGPRPKQLRPFVALDGGRHQAPSTPGDLLMHIKADSADLCFELAMHLTGRLRGAATIVDEITGFRYFEQRDLLGFVDGTANPDDEDALPAALIGDQDPDFRGGSYVVTQKYLHDMDSWRSLSTEEQERVVGRTKLDDIELDEQPANSHVGLTDLDGTDFEASGKHASVEIVRDNMPFGSLSGPDGGEFGTFFIGYAGDLEVTEQMLRNMFIGSPVGVTDRILDFSTAVTGNVFFVPTIDFLDDLPPAPDQPAALPGTELPGTEQAGTAPDDNPTKPAAVRDTSLGIGSLKEDH